MLDVAVIEDPAAAEVSLDPIRARVLAELGSRPASASSLAATMGLPRQKVNYHLRELERHGLVALVEERRKGNMTERVMRASAAAYVISPALAAFAPDPDRSPDQLSALWVLALGARLVREIGTLIERAKRARRPLATFAVDTEIRFASAADRAGFAAELSDAVESLVSKYHDARAARGRPHRLLVALHPRITERPGE